MALLAAARPDRRPEGILLGLHTSISSQPKELYCEAFEMTSWGFRRKDVKGREVRFLACHALDATGCRCSLIGSPEGAISRFALCLFTVSTPFMELTISNSNR